MDPYEHELGQGTRRKIREARQDSARFNFESRDQIVSRLTFGFWTNLFSKSVTDFGEQLSITLFDAPLNASTTDDIR